jgi:perosamine synthetase
MIRVAEPLLGEAEIENVVDCLRRGMISGTIGGDYLAEFERLAAESCGVAHGIATSSGTTALALAVASLDIGPGDEVIVPSFTNIATAFAAVYVGATPVFVDVDKRTWNIDVDRVRAAITPQTKAIVPVHIYGHPADMDPLVEIARTHKLLLIEDAAEAHGATYRGRQTGGLGDAGCLSFYANKIITTGEGGMLVTDSADLAARARELRNLSYSATDRFIHERLGYNFRMTNMQAALGVAQMGRFTEILELKRRVAERYREALARVVGLTLPVEESWAKNVYWVFGVVLDDSMPDAAEVSARLLEQGIETRRFFHPLHRQPVFVERGLGGAGEFPVSDRLWRKGLYLPSGAGISDAQIDTVVAALKKSLG